MNRCFALLALLTLGACPKPGNSPTEALGPAFNGPASRVASLAPSLTNLVLALEAGDALLGVTRFDDAPEVAALPRVGGYNDPSLETLLRLKPDLVICQPSPGNRGAVRAVADAGFPVRVFPLETLADVRQTTLTLGKLLEREEQARTLVARLDEARITARKAANLRPRRPKAALLVGVAPLVAAGPGSFADELLTDSGALNVVERSPQAWPRLSDERLLAQAPDVLFVVDVEGGIDVSMLPDALARRVVRLRSVGLLQPGASAIDALQELTAILDRLVGVP